MGNLFWIVISLFIISTVIGAIAKAVNNMNEQNAAARNRQSTREERSSKRSNEARSKRGDDAPVVKQSGSDMDRFLAEIDRLRRKNAASPPPATGMNAPVAPIVQPVKQPDRPKPRIVAELVETRGLAGEPAAFTAPPSAPPPRPEVPLGLSLATTTAPASTTGAPATKVTRILGRARAAPKSPFAKNLTAILNSGNGLALAVVLQEILGPPKSKKKV